MKNTTGNLQKVIKKFAQLHHQTQQSFDADGLPIVYQVGNTTVVGEQTVRSTPEGYITGYFLNADTDHKLPTTMLYDYYSAISYCIAKQRGMDGLALDISESDRLVAKYDFDRKNFLRSLQSALKKKDSLRAEIMHARLEDATMAYTIQQRLLTQLCFRAKYKHN